ncbi:MAG: hypothetical protein IT294_00065 [Deltaproteobacteria bacterium]|nr:hypothetical protein [Deltaproteobacteria bacterium]
MTLAPLRRLLAFHPRAMLVVLLALAIELVPPPAALVRHRHVGGDAAHVHAGRLTGVAHADRAADEGRGARAGAAVASAGPADLHAHLAPPAIVAALAAIVPPAPALVVAPAPLDLPPRTPPAAVRSTQARAPPIAV